MNIIDLQKLISNSDFINNINLLTQEDWFRISKFLILSEDFMNQYSKFLVWSEVWYSQKYSIDFLINNVDNIQCSDWICILNKCSISLDFVQKIWCYLPFDDNFFFSNFEKIISRLKIPSNYLFKGNKFSSEISILKNQLDEYEKWHCGGSVQEGYWNVFVGNNAKLTLQGVKNHICCRNNAEIHDYGNGSQIIVGDNSYIISHQQYNDRSSFWQWIHGFNNKVDVEGIYSIRPEWTKHYPLTVKLGNNSSIIVKVNDKFYSFKSGLDLKENTEYTFHVGNIKWSEV